MMRGWQVIGEVVKAYIANGSPLLGFAALLSFLVYLTLLFGLAVWSGLPSEAVGAIGSAFEGGKAQIKPDDIAET